MPRAASGSQVVSVGLHEVLVWPFATAARSTAAATAQRDLATNMAAGWESVISPTTGAAKSRVSTQQHSAQMRGLEREGDRNTVCDFVK